MIKNINNIKDKIYTIRGVQVMLDFDLAELYGYTTSAFNQQVKNNIEKFEGDDFMFRLDEGDFSETLLSKNLIAKTRGRGGDRRMPYAFTESGIYMLMTVLKGELAVRQSRTLIRIFRAMKEYIINNQFVLDRTVENTAEILDIRADVKEIKNEMSTMLRKSDISPILLDFSKTTEPKEFLIMNGEIVKAKDTIINIYNKAKKKIIVIDNYINYNTLRLLLETKQNLEIIIIYTDNANHYLKKNDINEFKKERPDIDNKLIKNDNKIHDRFIIIDNEKFYILGASSKDIGNKITTMHEITDEVIISKLVEGLRLRAL